MIAQMSIPVDMQGQPIMPVWPYVVGPVVALLVAAMYVFLVLKIRAKYKGREPVKQPAMGWAQASGAPDPVWEGADSIINPFYTGATSSRGLMRGP